LGNFFVSPGSSPQSNERGETPELFDDANVPYLKFLFFGTQRSVRAGIAIFSEEFVIQYKLEITFHQVFISFYLIVYSPPLNFDYFE
jgi:hypothetical protein